jgi:hypothetical protein
MLIYNTPKYFRLWFGGIWMLALVIPFAPLALPAPQAEPRPESSKNSDVLP